MQPRPNLALTARVIGLFATSATTAALLATPARALVDESALPDGVRHITSVEGIDEYVLENGLKVLLFPDPSKEQTTVNITYMVGSGHEGYGETGMAHLLEHLVFKGSTNHPDIPQELTAHGCRPNGTTWTDRTNYFETFASSRENLEWALDLEADRMLNSFISAEDLASEMTVVRNEFEVGENQPTRILEERVYSTAYLWHNYGNTTIGARSDIENVPIENLKAFYQRWYRPANAMLVVAGRFDEVEALGLIHEKFAGLQNPDTPLPTLYTEEPAQDGERMVTLRRVGDVQVASVAYHVPATSHPDHPAVELLTFILGDTPSGRLHEALIETQMATRIRAHADRFRDPGLLYISAEVRKDGDLDAVRDELLRIVEDVASTPPTEEELERAKENYARGWELAMRNTSWAAIGLSEWAAMGDWRLRFLHRDRAAAVTIEDVQRVATDYLVAANRTVGLYVPTDDPSRATIPPTPDVAEMLTDYEGGEAMAMGEVFEPTPENIESRAHRVTLPSGAKLVLVPKKTRGETVAVSLQMGIGNEEALTGLQQVGALTGDMLMRGTKMRSREEIQDDIDRLRGTLRVGGSATGIWGSAQATRTTIEPLLELMLEVVKEPSFPESEFAQLRDEALLDQEEAKSNPRSRAFNVFWRHVSSWPSDHVRYTMTPDEAMAAISEVEREDLVRFHDAFYGASSAEVAVVGDFDAAAVEALLTRALGEWTNPTPYAHVPSPYVESPAIAETVETPDKESAVFFGGLRVKMRDDDEDYPAMTMANYITGGGFLNSRLATRIRRTDGLSYGVGSRFRASSRDENGTFTTFAIYAPQNDARLVQAFWEEIQRVLDEGFTETELEEARRGWLQQQELSRANESELAARLTDRADVDRTLVWDAGLESRIAELTPQDLQDAFRRHVDLGKITIIRAGDFAGAGQQAEVVAP